jgi:Tfp pilus assembly protein PilV
MNGEMVRSRFQSMLTSDQGVSLIETVMAVALLGTVVIGIVQVLVATSRTAVRVEESITLTQLVRAQIETIQQSPFEEDPTQYPAISDIPEGFTVSVTSSDPGPVYAYPAPSTTIITNVIQQIVVTATGDFSELDKTFYKVRAP